MELTKMTINSKLLGVFFLMELTMVLLCIFLIYQAKGLTNLAQKINIHPLTVSNAIRDIKSTVNAIHLSMKDAVFATSPEELKNIIKKISAYEKEILETFDLVEDRFLGDRRYVMAVRKNYENWRLIREGAIELVKQGKHEEAAAITKGKGADQVTLINFGADEKKGLNFLGNFAQKKAEEFQNRIKQKEKQTIIEVSIIIILTIIISIFVVFLFVSAMKSVSTLQKVQERLSLDESRLQGLLKLTQFPDVSMKEITDFVLDQAVRLTSSTIGYLAFTNDDETELAMHSWSKEAMKQCAISDKPLVYSLEKTGLWGEAVRQRKPIICNDYLAPNPYKKGYPVGHIKLVRHMNIPVFEGERIVAVAGVGNKKGEYDETDIRQLTLLMKAMWSIIQRKRTNEVLKENIKNLRESEKRFRTLIENSHTGISIVQDTDIIYQNQEQERLLGPLPRPFVFKNYEDFHPDDVKKVEQFIKTIQLKKEKTFETDFRFYSKNSKDSGAEMKWVYCRANLIEYQGKEAILFNMLDVTKFKEMEQLVNIQDKMSSLGRVAAGIAHEIRNPLSGINIYLETLEKFYDKGDNLDTIKKIISQLKTASFKIESIVSRVMDFSKPGQPHFILSDLNRPLEAAIDLSSVTLRKSGITIEKNLTEDKILCLMDPNLLEEVILNLITNAAEAMRAIDGNKIIRINSFAKPDHAIVTVSDSGPGIPVHLREKIFDPFFSTKNESQGIGLSISHRILKDHNASVKVGTSDLGGAEFIFKIPIPEGKEQA